MVQCGDGGCGNWNIQEVNEFVSGVHHDVWSGDLGIKQERGNSAAGPTQSSPLVLWCWHPPPKSVPAVGTGRLTSGLL